MGRARARSPRRAVPSTPCSRRPPAPAGDGWRTVGKGGIRLDNVDYIAGPLGALVGERVCVRQDPADLDRIFVYLADGTFVCVAEDPARTGANRATVAQAMKRSASTRDREARARARDLAKRHRPERAMDDVLAKAAAEAERVVALPRKAHAHETPALREAARAAEAADAVARDARDSGIRARDRSGAGDTNEGAAPAALVVRAARKRIAAANRRFMEEDEGWLR